jgi:hypothetical protein
VVSTVKSEQQSSAILSITGLWIGSMSVKFGNTFATR